MFVGHYGVSFAAASLRRDIPLWVLFVAVQLMDIVWAALVLLGVEKLSLAPGITAANPLDLSLMPYSHSLVAAVLWSAAGFLVYRLVRVGHASAAALLVGLTVLSHWAADLLVHRPDLPLYDDIHKIGLGLWDHPVLSFLLEGALLAVGLLMYLHSTAPRSPLGRYGMAAFGAVLLAAQAGFYFAPSPPTPTAVAVSALTLFAVFTAVAAWLEWTRV